MLTRSARQQWFLVRNPNALVGREHDQADMFRDVIPESANDDHHPPPLFRSIWNWLH